MIDIINRIKQELAENGTEDVYSAFDAVPVSSKGDFFTVIGFRNFESLTPIYSQYIVYIPFRAELEITVTAPKDATMEEIYNYYKMKIGGIIDSICGLTNNICRMSVKPDNSIKRFILSVGLSLEGMKKIERKTEI